MSFRVAYISKQLLSLYVNISRSFGILYNSPSCSPHFTGLHPNQSKIHSLKMLNLFKNIPIQVYGCLKFSFSNMDKRYETEELDRARNRL